MIREGGNISNVERVKRQVLNIINTYSPDTTLDECVFVKTSKGNWAIYKGSNGRKICIISKFLLSDEVKNTIIHGR